MLLGIKFRKGKKKNHTAVLHLHSFTFNKGNWDWLISKLFPWVRDHIPWLLLLFGKFKLLAYNIQSLFSEEVTKS